jgi:hypothetical protein
MIYFLFLAHVFLRYLASAALYAFFFLFILLCVARHPRSFSPLSPFFAFSRNHQSVDTTFATSREAGLLTLASPYHAEAAPPFCVPSTSLHLPLLTITAPPSLELILFRGSPPHVL